MRHGSGEGQQECQRGASQVSSDVVVRSRGMEFLSWFAKTRLNRWTKQVARTH